MEVQLAWNENVTQEGFDDEASAHDWLVRFLLQCKDSAGQPFFRAIERECCGVPIYRHHRQSIDKEQYRCDILALPRSIENSSLFGAMVFEVKKSGEKIGKPLSQLKDYMACAFSVKGIMVVPSFGFLFPCHKQHSATASWMQNQSLGSASWCDRSKHLRIFSGEERLLEFDCRGNLLHLSGPKSGRGCGSR